MEYSSIVVKGYNIDYKTFQRDNRNIRTRATIIPPRLCCFPEIFYVFPLHPSTIVHLIASNYYPPFFLLPIKCYYNDPFSSSSLKSSLFVLPFLSPIFRCPNIPSHYSRQYIPLFPSFTTPHHSFSLTLTSPPLNHSPSP